MQKYGAVRVAGNWCTIAALLMLFISMAGTANATLSTPILSSCPSAASLDVGQSVSCTATISGGTSPYTYNWLISTFSGPITSNMLFTSVSSTSNTFTYKTVSADTFNSPEQFNVIVTDSTPTTVNSVYSSFFTIAPALVAGAITPASPTIDNGQSITLISNPSGGTTNYSYKWYTISGTTAPTCTSANVISGATSSTYSASPTSTNSYAYQVTDSATTPVSICSAGDTVTVNPTLSVPTISPSSPTIDNGQSITFTATWSGGTSSYTADLYSSTTSTCNSGSTLVQTLSSLASGSATFSSVSPVSNTWYCVSVTDNALEESVTGTIANPSINVPYGVAFSPDGTYAYLTNYGSNNVLIINTATNTVTGTINNPNIKPLFSDIAFSPSGTYAYLANANDNNVLIINTATNTVTGTITSGFNNPVGVAFSPSGTYAYVTNQNTNNVVIINTATNTVTGTITSGFNNPVGAAFSPSGTYAYVSNQGASNVVIINTATNSVTGVITSGINGPYGVAFSPSGTYAYVTNQNTKNVVIINTATNAIIIDTFNSPSITNPFYIAFSPSGTYAYLVNELTNKVLILTGENTEYSQASDITVNPVLGIPTLTSNPAFPSTQNTGNTITFTATWSGGTSSYTANYQITNTITGSLVANMLFTGISGTSNSFAWTIPLADAGSTVQANVLTTDSASSPATTNSIKSSTLTIIVPVTTTTTTVSSGFGSGNSGGVILSTASTISTSSTSTSTISTSTIMPITAIPIITPSGPTARTCNNLVGYEIVYHSVNAVFNVASGIHGCFSITVVNATMKYHASNSSVITAVNYTSSNSNVSVSATFHYNCSIASSDIAPFILKNGTWDKINPFTANITACYVTFAIPSDPVIAIINLAHSTSTVQTTTNTTIVPTTRFAVWHGSSTPYITAIIIIVIIIIIIILAYAYSRKRGHWGR